MPILTPKKLVVLDFDGVVVEGTNEAYIECYADAIAAAGVDVPFELVQERILGNWGKSSEIEIAGVIPERPDRVETAHQYYELHIDERLLEAAKPIAGAVEAIEQLAADYRLAIVSGMGQRVLDRLVEDFGIQEHFIAVVSTSTSSDPEKQKHTGYHVRQVMEAAEAAVSEVVCVGDGISEITMAGNLSVDLIIVLSGTLSADDAAAHGVENVAASLAEVPQLLRGWKSR